MGTLLTVAQTTSEETHMPSRPLSLRRAGRLIGLAALLYLGFVLFADHEAVFAALRRVGLPVAAAL